MHWADVVANELKEQYGDQPQVFATAITPSGPIHVGNMREVLTTEAIFRAALEKGADAELIYIADDYDPLRKVYPFLDDSYEEHVGKPLREVPCPCGEHENYARHFLEPFLRNLEALGIKPRVLSAYDMYHNGDYVEATKQSFDNVDKVREIIETVSKRQLPKKWAPFNPQCGECGKISGVEVTLFEYPELSYQCPCGHEGTHDINTPGIGKLPWRLDWPARWVFLGVTFEAFGKDHGAKGGSWDTGKPLVRDVYGGTEPHHVMYEFLNLKGKGAMHSSSGLAVSADDVLQMTPPEVLRYMLMKQSPRKHIDFDPGLGVMNLVGDFDRFESIYHGVEENPGSYTEVDRTYELSCPNGVPETLPAKAQYGHLVTVAQMSDDIKQIAAILERSGEMPEGANLEALAERVHHVRFWLANFAPENVKFQVQETLPEFDFSGDDKAFLGELVNVLAEVEWTGRAIHDAVYAAKGERKPGEAFRAVYQAILGQDRGPRAGFFLSSLDRKFVIERFASV
jgi:lysyl-tRNA synthetase class 1